MNFTDYKGRQIMLSDESWLHIQEGHPEITISTIAKTLSEPDEVRSGKHAINTELFYQLKIYSLKTRYRCVIVKVLGNESFVSTAMTTSSMKSGEILYKKVQGE